MCLWINRVTHSETFLAVQVPTHTMRDPGIKLHDNYRPAPPPQTDATRNSCRTHLCVYMTF